MEEKASMQELVQERDRPHSMAIVTIAAITPLASIILTPFHLDMNCVMVCSDLSCSPVSAISDCQSPEMLAQE